MSKKIKENMRQKKEIKKLEKNIKEDERGKREKRGK